MASGSEPTFDQLVIAEEYLREKIGPIDPSLFSEYKGGVPGKYYEEVIEFKFKLIRPDIQEVTGSALKRIIEEAGGCATKKEGNYTINILDDFLFEMHPTLDMIVPPDTFSSRYIFDAIYRKQKKVPLPDIWNYLISGTKYEKYDPLQILKRELSKTDLIPLSMPNLVKVRARGVVNMKFEAFLASRAQVKASGSSKTNISPRKPSTSKPEPTSPTSEVAEKRFCSSNEAPENRSDEVLIENDIAPKSVDPSPTGTVNHEDSIQSRVESERPSDVEGTGEEDPYLYLHTQVLDGEQEEDSMAVSEPEPVSAQNLENLEVETASLSPEKKCQSVPIEKPQSPITAKSQSLSKEDKVPESEPVSTSEEAQGSSFSKEKELPLNETTVPTPASTPPLKVDRNAVTTSSDTAPPQQIHGPRSPGKEIIISNKIDIPPSPPPPDPSSASSDTDSDFEHTRCGPSRPIRMVTRAVAGPSNREYFRKKPVKNPKNRRTSKSVILSSALSPKKRLKPPPIEKSQSPSKKDKVSESEPVASPEKVESWSFLKKKELPPNEDSAPPLATSTPPREVDRSAATTSPCTGTVPPQQIQLLPSPGKEIIVRNEIEVPPSPPPPDPSSDADSDFEPNHPGPSRRIRMVTRAVAGPSNREYFGKRPAKNPMNKGKKRAVMSDSEMEDLNFEDNDAGPTTRRKKLRIPSRKYDLKEDILMVKKLIKHDAFKYYKGRKVYMLLAQQVEEFRGQRSWQSLRNRMIRNIMKDIENGNHRKYGLEEKDKRRIIETVKDIKVLESHENTCPEDLTFASDEEFE